MSKQVEMTVRYCRLDNLAESDQSEHNCAVAFVKELIKAGIVGERKFVSSDEIVYQLIFKG